MPTDAQQLAASTRSFVIAPAGFGKTELIARAIEVGCGRSLVLTHTHSGVNALRMRLKRLGVDRTRYDVATIAGWALRYASAFPALSGITDTLPTGDAWAAVYDAAIRLLTRRVARGVLERSFSGVYVDEYQDCSLRQHAIVMAIAGVLPCRLLGDPLQGIFGFRNDPTIDWKRDVVPFFERLPDLDTPHRWRTTNPELGCWVSEVRPKLAAGIPVDLRCGPLQWCENTIPNQYSACMAVHRRAGKGSVVAIAKWPNDCHQFASRMGGVFGSMEELDCRALMTFARGIDGASTGYEQAALLIGFADQCFTAVGADLRSTKTRYENDDLPDPRRLTKTRRIVELLNRLATVPSPRAIIDAARAFEDYADARLYRRELWHEMKTTVLTSTNGALGTLEETAWWVRDKARRLGRRVEGRVVSRTLLVKGLEFEHCVVLNADPFDAKNAYVAMTRGSHSLAVLSTRPIVKFGPVANLLD